MCIRDSHLNEFALMENKKYSREELLEIFRTVTPESVWLRRRWADLSRKSLVEFAKKVRSEIDKIAPDTRISLCQSGVSDFDGFFIEDVASALAGKTRPLVRLYGTNYSSFEDISIPETVFHALDVYKRQVWWRWNMCHVPVSGAGRRWLNPAHRNQLLYKERAK